MPSPPTTGSRQRNNRSLVVVPGDCSSVTRAQEPASQVVLTPDSVTSMYWLHGQLHLHDYHPAYNEETIKNDPRLDEETVMAGSAWSDNQDYTGTGAAMLKGPSATFLIPPLLVLLTLTFLPLSREGCPARLRRAHPRGVASLTQHQAQQFHSLLTPERLG